MFEMVPSIKEIKRILGNILFNNYSQKTTTEIKKFEIKSWNLKNENFIKFYGKYFFEIALKKKQGEGSTTCFYFYIFFSNKNSNYNSDFV